MGGTPDFTPPTRPSGRKRKSQRLRLNQLAKSGGMNGLFKKECKEALGAAIPQWGMRWELTKKLVWFLAVYERHGDAAIKRRIEKWLTTKNHVSEDLTKTFDETVLKTLDQIPGLAGGYRQKHDIAPGKRSSTDNHELQRKKAGLPVTQHYPSSTHTLKCVQLKALRQYGRWRKVWRKTAASFATDADRATFSGSHPWLRRTMPVFAGLLQLMLLDGCYASLHSDDLHTIATGNPVPEAVLPPALTRSGRWAPYRVMLHHAKKARWLRLKTKAVEGVHADVYEITINPRRRRR